MTPPLRLPGNATAELQVVTNDEGALDIDTCVETSGDAATITVTTRALRDLEAIICLRVEIPHPFGVALYRDGVLQRSGDVTGWVAAPGLECFYTVDTAEGTCSVTPDDPTLAACQWLGGTGTAVSLLLVGDMEPRPIFQSGEFGLADACDRGPIKAGMAAHHRIQVQHSAQPCAAVLADTVHFSDDRDALTHQVALWGSLVPSLGTLAVKGSAYPTINLPRREYGTLHTFFDPDAWSVVSGLSYSGVDTLIAQARDVIERAVSHIDEAGLVPHHFDGDVPTYIAISGSPQPGPNLFLVEAALDHACATGDFAWLGKTWSGGLGHACRWLLNHIDPAHGLLDVVGSLWIDVFQRAGLTLDTNAMAVRTFRRAAEAAELLGDARLADDLARASRVVSDSLQSLWREDHFVTSLDTSGAVSNDHVDAENYLAIAVGATTADQANAIVDLFDASPLTHPGGRGTWVSLRRYDGEDCYLHNTGDSDTAMARLWWADMSARQTMGDRTRFMPMYEAVRNDLLALVWMRERYAAGGFMTRAMGYHEYPDIVDMLLREGVYGLRLNVLTADIAPMRDWPFHIRLGGVELACSSVGVSFRAPGVVPRMVSMRGLEPSAQFTQDGVTHTVDETGTLRVKSLTVGQETILDLRRVEALPL